MWHLKARFVLLQSHVQRNSGRSHNRRTSVNHSRMHATNWLGGLSFSRPSPQIRPFITMKMGLLTINPSSLPAPLVSTNAILNQIRSSHGNFAIFPGGGVEAYSGKWGFRLDIGDEIYFRMARTAICELRSGRTTCSEDASPTMVVGLRSQRCARNFSMIPDDSAPLSLVPRFAATWFGLRMPGMVVLTRRSERMKRSASSGNEIPCGTSFFSFSTRSTVGPRFSGPK